MNVLRYVLLGLAVCVLLALGWRSMMFQAPVGAPRSGTAGASYEADQLSAARKLVEARMAEVPEFAAFYRQLDADFPRTYGSVVDDFSHKLAGAGTLPTPDAMILEALRELEQSQGVLAARASGAPLEAFFDARLAVLDALAPADPRQCADFLYGTADSPLVDFSAHHRDLVAALALRQLAAMTDGRDNRVNHGTPTAADFDLLANGLAAKKLTPDEISVLLDGKDADPPIQDKRLCDMGRIYLAVLRALPADSRQRIYGLAAELLARS